MLFLAQKCWIRKIPKTESCFLSEMPNLVVSLTKMHFDIDDKLSPFFFVHLANLAGFGSLAEFLLLRS